MLLLPHNRWFPQHPNKVVKQVLGEEVCKDLLFLYAFTGCDSVSRVWGIGKKSGIPMNHQKRKGNERLFKSILSISQDVVETNGSSVM